MPYDLHNWGSRSASSGAVGAVRRRGASTHSLTRMFARSLQSGMYRGRVWCAWFACVSYISLSAGLSNGKDSRI